MPYIVRITAENDSESRIVDSTPFRYKRDRAFVAGNLCKALWADGLSVKKMEVIKA